MPAHALAIDHIETQYRDGEYRLTMTATLAAPLSRVEQVIRDFDKYPQLDERILESRVLPKTAKQTPDQAELFTRIQVCVAFLCRKVERVETVQLRPGEIIATVQPARSDAARGETHSELTADGEHTHLRYTTYIVPKFWVPGLFARPALLRQLHDATVSLFTNVEQRAQVP